MVNQVHNLKYALVLATLASFTAVTMTHSVPGEVFLISSRSWIPSMSGMVISIKATSKTSPLSKREAAFSESTKVTDFAEIPAQMQHPTLSPESGSGIFFCFSDLAIQMGCCIIPTISNCHLCLAMCILKDNESSIV